MESTRTDEVVAAPVERVELFDETGTLIGVIRRPVVRDLLGPGREKVFLSRTGQRRRPAAHAA